MSDFKAISSIIPVLREEAMVKPREAMSLLEKLEAWIALDNIEKAAKARKEALREDLLMETEAKGTQDDKGSFVLETQLALLTKEKRVDKLPDLKQLQALVEAVGKIKENEKPFDEVKTLVVNPSKLESLVERGLLPEQKVKECCGTTWALKVKVSKEVEEAVKQLKTEAPIDVQPVAGAPKGAKVSKKSSSIP